MVQSLQQWEEQRKWTAFTECCKSGLDSSGFLRVGIMTYLRGRRPEWVESQKIKIGQLMPTIVGAIMAAGPPLEKMKREREEQQKRYREEEAPLRSPSLAGNRREALEQVSRVRRQLG